MIIHKRNSSNRETWALDGGKAEVETDQWVTNRTECGRRILPSWLKSGEGNVVVDPQVFKFENHREENGTLSFTKEVCKSCLNRRSLLELAAIDLEGPDDFMPNLMREVFYLHNTLSFATHTKHLNNRNSTWIM